MIKRIYVKELKDMFRDTKTLLLSVVVPVIMISLMLFFFESMFFSENKVELSRVAVTAELNPTIKESLEQNPTIELLTVSDPMQAAVDGEARLALLTSETASAADANSLPNITIYADQSSTSSSNAVGVVMGQLEVLKDQIMLERLNSLGIDRQDITAFETSVQSLSGGEEVSLMLLSMLFSIVIVMSVMLGGFPAATDLFAGEKERKTMEALLIAPVSRMKLITAKWLTIATIGSISGVFSVLAFLLITRTLTPNIAQAIDFGSQSVILFLSAVVGIVAFALMFSTIQMMISIIAKSFKEAQNYLSPVMFVGMVPYFLLLGVVPNEFTFGHYVIPFMNIYVLLKELIYGIYSIQTILYVVGSTALVVAVAFTIANWMFTKDKWVLGK
ncbi:ABC transporter permease [Bacillus horti]|uniref:Sodium transport system permease protein n=1 Tax=Caldalkalibacillus horti TaxID=77523 RepID=A0ABT9VW74_9BACI|nr:ABC transporter permease [Bacillus horti]MDQ0165228.1 sodium transport system permease protein [Bacillus horti]